MHIHYWRLSENADFDLQIWLGYFLRDYASNISN